MYLETIRLNLNTLLQELTFVSIIDLHYIIQHTAEYSLPPTPIILATCSIGTQQISMNQNKHCTHTL